MTKEEVIQELEATIKELGSAKDLCNQGNSEKAQVVIQTMSLLANLKGWKGTEVIITGFDKTLTTKMLEEE
jgi:hypothetical protein